MRRGRRGANALEFALAYPLVVVMVVVLFELSYALNRSFVLQGAAWDGARHGAMARTAEEAEERVTEEVLSILGRLDTADVQIETEVLGVSPVRVLRVRVIRPYSTVTGAWVPSWSQLDATAVLRMEDAG